MAAPNLTPALFDVLTQADRGNVLLLSTRRPDRWLVDGEPNTPAVQCLIDAGLLVADEYADRAGGWRVAEPTPAGRALLDTLNQEGN